MEAGGLAVGVVGLAALFNSCVEALGYVSSAQSFAEDFAILQTQLDIEKIQLLQWGRRVGIIAAAEDEDVGPTAGVEDQIARLDTKIQRMVFETLLAMQSLLTSSECLVSKYSTAIVLEQSASSEVETTRSSLIRAYERRKGRQQAHQRRVGIWQKVVWACRDKEKLQGVVDGVTRFNGKLDGLVPTTTLATERALVGQITQELRSEVTTLRTIVQAASVRRSAWADAASEQLALSGNGSATNNSYTSRMLHAEQYFDDRRALLGGRLPSTVSTVETSLFVEDMNRWSMSDPSQMDEFCWIMKQARGHILTDRTTTFPLSYCRNLVDMPQITARVERVAITIHRSISKSPQHQYDRFHMIHDGLGNKICFAYCGRRMDVHFGRSKKSKQHRQLNPGRLGLTLDVFFPTSPYSNSTQCWTRFSLYHDLSLTRDCIADALHPEDTVLLMYELMSEMFTGFKPHFFG